MKTTAFFCLCLIAKCVVSEEVARVCAAKKVFATNDTWRLGACSLTSSDIICQLQSADDRIEGGPGLMFGSRCHTETLCFSASIDLRETCMATSEEDGLIFNETSGCAIDKTGGSICGFSEVDCSELILKKVRGISTTVKACAFKETPTCQYLEAESHNATDVADPECYNVTGAGEFETERQGTFKYLEVVFSPHPNCTKYGAPPNTKYIIPTPCRAEFGCWSSSEATLPWWYCFDQTPLASKNTAVALNLMKEVMQVVIPANPSVFQGEKMEIFKNPVLVVNLTLAENPEDEPTLHLYRCGMKGPEVLCVDGHLSFVQHDSFCQNTGAGSQPIGVYSPWYVSGMDGTCGSVVNRLVWANEDPPGYVRVCDVAVQDYPTHDYWKCRTVAAGT